MRYILFFSFIFSFFYGYTQNDTTAIDRYGDKYTKNDSSINKQYEEISNLEKGKKQFKFDIKQLKSKKDSLQSELTKIKGNINKKIILEQEIVEIEKKITAIEKGIAMIDAEIDSLKGKKKAIYSDVDEPEDTQKYDWLYRNDRFKAHWTGIDLGLNNYLNSDYEIINLSSKDAFMQLTPLKSWSIAINFVQKSFQLTSNSGFFTGAGIEWNNYHFENNITLFEDSTGVISDKQIIENQDSEIDFMQNSLNLIYLNVPLFYEFNIPLKKSKKPFLISVGVIGNLRIASKTKQLYDNKKDKKSGDFNLSPVGCEASLRIGYRAVKLFANYNLTAMFKQGEGPELYPFCIGVSLLNAKFWERNFDNCLDFDNCF